jgi:hypothetical protein
VTITLGIIARSRLLQILPQVELARILQPMRERLTGKFELLESEYRKLSETQIILDLRSPARPCEIEEAEADLLLSVFATWDRWTDADTNSKTGWVVDVESQIRHRRSAETKGPKEVQKKSKVA